MFDSDGYDPDGYGPTTVRSASYEEARAPRRSSLEGKILKKLANINAAQAELVSLIDEHDREEFWADWAGINSEPQWLSFRAGLPTGAGRSYLGLARALRDLPTLRASFSAGKLTLQQVKAVADIATAETDEALTELAESLTGTQLTAFCRYYREALRANEDPSPTRRLDFHYNNRGTCRVSTQMPSERAAIIERALMAVENDVTLDEDADDPYAARRADALVAVAEASLACDPKTRAERYQVVIHADAERLQATSSEDEVKDDEPKRAPYIEGAGAIGDIALEQILCQCSIVPLLERHGGEPLDIGRASRTPTTAIRRALKARDRHCRFPGCSNDAFTEAHHIFYWSNLGETKVEELVLICWTHHRMVHRQRIRIEISRDGPVFIDSGGRVIKVPPRIEMTETLEDEDIDEETCLPLWGGEPGNMRYVADRYLEDADLPALV